MKQLRKEISAAETSLEEEKGKASTLEVCVIGMSLDMVCGVLVVVDYRWCCSHRPCFRTKYVIFRTRFWLLEV